MKYVLCAAFLFSMNASAADSPPFEIKGLTTGMSPSGFIAKFKEVAKECKNEPVTSEYTILPGAVANIRFESSRDCMYSASAEFGMVDQKAISVDFVERFPEGKKVLAQHVAGSLTEKYGNNYTTSFDFSDSSESLEWFLRPVGGVYSLQEFNSSSLHECNGFHVALRGGIRGMRFGGKPVESSKIDSCFKHLKAVVLSNGGFSYGYKVGLNDYALSRISWGNDKKMIESHSEKEKDSIEKSSKSSAPKI